MTAEHELIEIVKGIRNDLDFARRKTNEALRLLAEMNLPDPTVKVCPECGLTFRSEAKQAEHLYISHDYPDPPHWLAAEQLADEEPNGSP